MTFKRRETTQIRASWRCAQGARDDPNRVDQVGVAEPSIQQQGEKPNPVQIPGVQGYGGPRR